MPNQPYVVRFADCTLDMETGELQRNGRKIVLPEQALQILAALLETPGKVVKRETLVRRLWPAGTFVDFEQSLNKSVARLRKSLAEFVNNPDLIETLPRKGYRWIGTVDQARSGVSSSEASCKESNRQLEYGARRVNGGSAHDDESYRLSLLGRFHLVRRTDTSIQSSIECFQQAKEHDPNSSLAHIGLAEAYLAAEYSSLVPPWIAYPIEKAAIDRALELDTSNAQAHVVLAMLRGLHEWDLYAAQEEFLAAIAIDPNSSDAWHRYAIPFLTSQRRFFEAEEAIRKALESDPLSLLINCRLGVILSYAKQFKAAEAHLLKTLEMDPNSPETHNCLGQMYLWWGKTDKAYLHIRKGMSLSQDSLRMRCILAGLLAAVGRRDEARSELNDFIRLTAERYISPALLALVYVGLDCEEESLQELEKALQERSPLLPVLNAWPTFDNLRVTPRFQALFPTHA